ncbi:HepT-like ribonuclease domain-containing protein [Pseudonocardia kunmingensis]|uniref:HepT-like ribonuclease domain-containing protein n=1 Tax=Pseudonocardia kunmingensis TaxID=630975 RepID=UPI001FE715EF|nr:DUF86 domain-containing protein [Pseudonocardia kunmingensis]
MIQAGEAVQRFVDGLTLAGYRDDLLVRSAVERQLEIAGEALNQLSRVDHGLAARIPDVGAVVGFRNVLVHGYAQVDDTRVWRTVHESVPTLLETVRRLRDELDG